MDTSQKKPNVEKIYSDDFYQTIFSQAGDGIFLVDEEGCILEANPRGCEILGYTRDELRGMPVMSLHPVDEIQHIQKELERLAIDKLVTVESVFTRKDGSLLPIEITGKILPNNQIIGLLRDISERKKMEKVIQELLITDPLTGLYNRRYFFSVANALIAESTRYGHPITFMLLDLDRFKNINDTYGHMKGDLALQHLANSIRYTTRESDIIARFGGDEFVILLPQSDKTQAAHLAERLQKHLSENPIQSMDNNFYINVSIGAACITTSNEVVLIDKLIERADQALYKAKQEGRNLIRIWSMSEI